MHSMPDLRSSSMYDTTSHQIPQNTTYEMPFQQQPSPSSSSPESINSQGKNILDQMINSSRKKFESICAILIKADNPFNDGFVD
jgi:hypothetical protein